MEQPILVLQKNAERNTNKMRIPQNVVDKWGIQYRMEIQTNVIKQ